MALAPDPSRLESNSSFSGATSLASSPRHAYAVLDSASGNLVHASSALRAILELPEASELRGSNLSSMLKGSGKAHLLEVAVLLETVPVLQRPTIFTAEGGHHAVSVSISPLDQCYSIAEFEDATQFDAELDNHGVRDSLTGIPNRARFEQILDLKIGDLEAGFVEGVIVLFLDLDRFKAVNDTLGHAVGDSLLRLVSERLQTAVRDGDTLARLGGDEFAIVLGRPSTRETASSLAERFINLLQRPYLIDGHLVNIGTSIGIAIAPGDGRTQGQLLRSADLALYHSKATGRGTYTFFQQQMEERAQSRRTLEIELRRALPLRQFELHYQPQIDVETQKITGLEALLRWRHPSQGLLPPAAFLSLAEEIGLAASIGEWVLKTACKEAIRWPDYVRFAVNVSPLHFDTENFSSSVERALKTAGLPGSRLDIEVTEDILLREGNTVHSTLERVRDLGVHVVMDGFGTGLASISQVVNFPFDKIKIHRSLMNFQETNHKNRAIVRAISALGQGLGISTLAEGVETQEHLAQVRSDGCNLVQGFYYSKAVPSAELSELFIRLSTPELLAASEKVLA